MTAVAVFSCAAGSHPFQERRVLLTDPVKIGRSVAQARPCASNTIFDCKVLSRNHALMWYEGSKFYMQDTKSSNGTFVNSQRLSKGSEESVPMEVFSGDTIQFGVDVMENSLTHNCIIAVVQLFHPNGQEAKNSNVPSGPLSHGLTSQELYQLAQCIQDATHRELALENKLTALQRLLQSTLEATEHSWQALVDEDRLLSRFECLEDQISVFSKTHTEDSLQKQILSLREDKFKYEIAAKESFRQLLEEKLEATKKVSDLELSLSNAEEECTRQQASCQQLHAELQMLGDKSDQQMKELSDLTSRLQEANKKLEDDQDLKVENQILQTKLEEMIAHVESLRAENDFVNEQMTNMKAKLELMKNTDSLKISNGVNKGVQADLVSLLDLQRLHADDVSPEKSDSGEDDENENSKVCDDEDVINKEMEVLLEEKSLRSEVGNSALGRASQLARLQFLEAQVRSLQDELDQERQRATSIRYSDSCSLNAGNVSIMQQEFERESVRNQVEFTKLKAECAELRQRIHDIELEMKQSRKQNEELREEYSRLQESYQELEQLKNRLQDSEISCHSNLTDAQKELDVTKSELSAMKLKLTKVTTDSESTISSLKMELSSTLEEYGVLSQTSRTLSYCATFPLVLLAFLLLVAFHPLLSVLTATTAPT